MKNLPTKDALKHASNEETAPADLHELAQHADHSVKMKVASHAMPLSIPFNIFMIMLT